MWSQKLKTCAAAPRAARPAAASVRRLGAPQMAAPAALSCTARPFSSDEAVSEELAWSKAMMRKYGSGNYQLFRPLYKDLCDEIRREYYTKPPPPPAPGTTKPTTPSRSSRAATTAVEETTDAVEKKEEAKCDSSDSDVMATSVTSAGEPLTHAPSPPAPQFGDGTWSVQHLPEYNVVTFHRDAVQEDRLGEIHAWSRVELKDPPRLNAVLTFADWIPMEVCVTRNGVIMHFSMAANEGGMHMRNVRVYAPTSPEEKAALLDPSEDGEKARKKFYYDGPCLWHLELDFQNELYDVMQDHGISLDWVHWAASWVFYLEHVSYVKWNLGMLEELIPSPLRGPESDFLSATERALLDEPVEDWLEAHSM